MPVARMPVARMPVARTRVARIGGLLGLLCALASTTARADEAGEWIDQAVRFDLEGHADLAYISYHHAAEIGQAEAEFNVAVMLDSGRGVAPDLAEAATWYARAAARGNHRAAYNLGQLYEAGQGVPRNIAVARAWFTASDVPAARARIAALRDAEPHGANARDHDVGPLRPPSLVAPLAGSRSGAEAGGVELVWTAPQPAEPVRYYVELRMLEGAASHEVFSRFTGTTGVLATIPPVAGDYTWRVSAVAGEAGRYAASDWQRFSVAAAATRFPAMQAPPIQASAPQVPAGAAVR